MAPSEPGRLAPAPEEPSRVRASRDFALAGAVGAARGPDSAAPNMLGDFLMGGAFGGSAAFTGVIEVDDQQNIRLVQPYGDRSLAAPFAFHTFKMAEKESPWPRNRSFFTANYFDDVGDSTAVTRELIGFERTYLDGRASVGLQLPFFTVDPGAQASLLFDSAAVGTFGAGTTTQSDVGDLTVVLKYAPYLDRLDGDVCTLGLAITPPTGPDTLADVDPLYTVDGVDHRGTIQPFAAFYQSLDRAWDGWFVHGFSAIDAPFDDDDATFWYNDLGLGYYCRRPRGSWVTAVVPTVEAHVNTPLDDRIHGVTATPTLAQLTSNRLTGVSGQVEYHNQVNLTSGVTFLFRRRAALALGVVVPLTGPKPFDSELSFQLNCLRGPGWPAAFN